MKIQIYLDGAHLWRWRAVADNGRIIADSAEGYDSVANVHRAVATVKSGFQQELSIERVESTPEDQH